GELLALARLVQTQQRAPVGAAVLERMQFAVGIARHHDRHVAEIGRPERVGARQLRLEAEKAPGVTAKDPLLLLRIEILVRIDPVGHASQALAGPLPYAGMHGHDLLQSKRSAGSILRRGRRLHTGRKTRAAIPGTANRLVAYPKRRLAYSGRAPANERYGSGRPGTTRSSCSADRWPLEKSSQADLGVLDDRFPAFAVLANECTGRLRRAADRLAGEVGQRLLDLRLMQRVGEFPTEPFDQGR